ncbi:hypothetical protein MRBBS_3236 [Marinobacter sp. BSs20148]|nr:hypothetical protein MRBBS_3236 [Marinobacter sp. BSs20148]
MQPHQLTHAEEAAILDTCNEREYQSLPPSQIVPRLADKGLYLASEASFYQSPAPYPSTLENCRKLSAINRLLKCSYLDNWVANNRNPQPGNAGKPARRTGKKGCLDV